jgi:hypothetical protein
VAHSAIDHPPLGHLLLLQGTLREHSGNIQGIFEMFDKEVSIYAHTRWGGGGKSNAKYIAVLVYYTTTSI